jgi:glucokinase
LTDWVVGIDLGGTNIRVAKVNLLGEISQSTFVEIDRAPQVQKKFHQIIEIVSELIDANKGSAPLGIGVGVTGPIDVYTGIIDNPFTLPDHFQGNIKAALSEKFDLPVVVENDANSACLGEAIFGAGKNSEVVACITIGTGIGVGVVKDGVVYRGAGGIHPEAGHMTIDSNGPECYCGKFGCLESLASGTALRNLGIKSNVLTPAQSAKDLFELAQKGNQRAQEIVSQANNALSIGVAQLISTYLPETIVVTGGAVNSSDSLIEVLNKTASEASHFMQSKTSVKAGSLGDWAGTIGAASCIISAL